MVPRSAALLPPASCISRRGFFVPCLSILDGDRPRFGSVGWGGMVGWHVRSVSVHHRSILRICARQASQVRTTRTNATQRRRGDDGRSEVERREHPRSQTDRRRMGRSRREKEGLREPRDSQRLAWTDERTAEKIRRWKGREREADVCERWECDGTQTRHTRTNQALADAPERCSPRRPTKKQASLDCFKRAPRNPPNHAG